MKVLQVLYSGLGGHGSVVTSLINADTNREWNHSLLFYGIEDLLPAYEEFCKNRDIPFSFVRKKKGILKPGGAAVKAALRKHDPDVIILHGPNLIFTVWWYCLFKRKRVFVAEHTSNNIKGFAEKVAGFFSLLLARKVVYLSEFYQRQIKRKFWFLPVRKKSLVIQNGIDLQKFKPEEKSKNDNELHTGMIGRFILPKNQAMIVEALEKGIQSGSFYRKIIVHFAGNGGSLADVQETVQKKNMQDMVQFHGLLDEEGIISFFQQLHFYVHASYAETMCTAVMQAMACGVPVLASDIPGINDIVREGENALLFANDDINALVRGLKTMQETNLRERVGNSARNYALKNFSSTETFNKYNQLVKNI